MATTYTPAQFLAATAQLNVYWNTYVAQLTVTPPQITGATSATILTWWNGANNNGLNALGTAIATATSRAAMMTAINAWLTQWNLSITPGSPLLLAIQADVYFAPWYTIMAPIIAEWQTWFSSGAAAALAGFP
jgi:hypothetical protein